MSKVLSTVTYCCRCQAQLDIQQQQFELAAYAQELNLTLKTNYSDNASSYKLEERLQFDDLMKAAIRKEFDCILIYKFTAFAAGVPHLLHVLKQFIQLDIRLISLHDQIDTKGQIGKEIVAALQMLIKLKETLIRERTMEGLQKARSKGKKLGRPTIPTPPHLIALIEELADTTNFSIKKIREETGNLLGYQATRDIIHRVRNQF